MKKRIVFAIIFILFSVLFYLVKYQSPHLVETLYRQEQFDLLNKIVKTKGQQSLEFYLGRANEALFGPVSQLIAGLLFAAFALLFLQEASLLKFGVSVFIFLILTKFEVLFFPPYGDAIGGPFVEAIWLARHSFDYVTLFHQDGYALGGPKVYMFSVYPTYLAILMKLIPVPKIFLVVNHLIVFASAAAIVSLLKDILSRLFKKDISILVSLVLLGLPVFQSQTEAINMEIPSTLFIMLSAHALIRRRITLSGMMVFCAILVKGTAVLAAAAFILISLFLFFGKTELRFNKKVLLWAIGLAVFSVVKVLSKFLINDQHVSGGMVSLGAGWPSLNKFRMSLFYIVSLMVYAGCYIKEKVYRKKDVQSSNPPSPSGFYEGGVMLTYAGMWFLLFLNFYAVSPRYMLAVCPFLLFCMFFALACLIPFHWMRKWGLVVVVAAAFFSSYGFFDGLTVNNDHVLLEKSLEYRNDLEINRRIVKALETRYENFQIVAPFIIAQLLAMPEMGYIHKDLDVMIYGFNCGYGDIENFPGVKQVRVGRTIYVGMKVSQIYEDLPYPVCPQDRVIEEIQYGNKKAWLFMGGVAIDSVLRATRMFQLKKLQERRQGGRE